MDKTLRKKLSENVTHQALDWKPTRSWVAEEDLESSTEEETNTSGTTWGAVRKVAQNQVCCRVDAEGYAAPRVQGHEAVEW